MALAATSGTPLDAVYTSATTMISGPMAGLVILFGALAVAVFFMFARGLEGGGLSHAVGWLIGGCIVAASLTGSSLKELSPLLKRWRWNGRT
jgi:hypothetical protein